MSNCRLSANKTTIPIDGTEPYIDDPAIVAQIAEGKARLDKLAAERLANGRFLAYFGMFSSEDGLARLQLIADQIPDSAYWSSLTQVWVSTKQTTLNRAVWLRMFTARRPGRLNLMSLQEQATLVAMPDVLTVYRGARPSMRDGLSWTPERTQAEWFANRCGGRVYTATIRKSSVFAYLNDHRSENEIVADVRTSRWIR